MKNIIVVTGASSGFGLMVAQALAKAGKQHTRRHATLSVTLLRGESRNGCDGNQLCR